MSENKKYYWLKLKKDFFEQKMIKILRTFERGNEMIMSFLKIELHSLENDGYIYYENMLPTFEQELAIAIDEDTSLVKLTLETLLRFGAVKKVDENKYYISAIEDCIGSETKDASRMRKKRSEQCSQTDEQCSQNNEHCPPEIEKEKETDIEKELYQEKRRTPSSFSDEKKGGRFSKQSNFSNNYSKNKSNSQRKHASYDLAEIQKAIDSQELVYVPNSKKNEQS